MGKKLDFLLRRNFKTCKYKSLVHTLSTRIAILEKKHRLQWLQSQSDVIELLKLGQQERALLRVEHMVMEQNTLDAFAMIEVYCNIVVERIMLIENNKECASELKEAIASLIFAASRCGELPELQKIRSLFTDRFGKELALRAIELRNNCGVSSKMVKKLSARRPNLESKLKVLKETAIVNGISLRLQRNPSSVSTEGTNQTQQRASESDNIDNPECQHVLHSANEQKQNKEVNEKVRGRKKYRDVRTAAQAAYKLAADAAEAAFAAMELSHPGDKDEDSETKAIKNVSNSEGSSKCLEQIALESKQYQKSRQEAHEETQSKVLLWPSSENEKTESNKNVGHPKEGSNSIQSVSSSSWGSEIFREVLRQNRQLRLEKGSNKNDDENKTTEKKSLQKNQKESNPENKSELPITPSKQASYSEGGSSHSESISRENSADIRVSNMARRPTPKRPRRLFMRKNK